MTDEEYFDFLLEECIKYRASDLHLTVGRPPTLRIDGKLYPIEKTQVLTPEVTAKFKDIATINVKHLRAQINDGGGGDFGLTFKDKARFRVAIYKQKGYFGLALRLIPKHIMEFEELGLLPHLVPKIKALLDRSHGLILVTGPTGCGKSTTQATFIDYILNSPRHVLTIEDPIEFIHDHKSGLVTQREVGIDVSSFREAIMKGLRSNPNVILVGEIRDLATAEATVWAAESGHLVIGTLHTTNASETITRFIDIFPPEIRDQIRIQFSISILAVFSQRLVLRAEGKGRIAAFEIMMATPAVRNLIRERKIEHLPSAIQTAQSEGSISFDAYLAELYRMGKITYETALANAFDPKGLRELVELGAKAKSRFGEATRTYG
uniref:PilT/PilU family type 4a pilus ATPase n=1 Tax=candidate division WOR-3 bacterium TaxID=2052148 RepID=A0A7C6EDX3_UNCW3